MNRIWSLLFLVMTVGVMVAFFQAANGWAPLVGAWLPENYSQAGKAIDGLFLLIHGISAVLFVGIGLAISFIVWSFGDARRAQARYFHSSLGLELLWSIVPGVILVGLAIWQWQAWSAARLDRPQIQVGNASVFQSPLVHVTARQFGWEFLYAGRDGQFETADDVKVENLMVVPVDEEIVMQLSSRDVIHSFFVPKLRFKHDLVPGMTQVAWFRPTATATMNILCAELCGWGHYKMNAVLKVVPRAEFDAWMVTQQKKNDPPELAPYLEGP